MQFSSFIVLALACVAQAVKASPTEGNTASAACVGDHCEPSVKAVAPGTSANPDKYLFEALRHAVAVSDENAVNGCCATCLVCVAGFCLVGC
ncbi:hypothetical protein B0H13DRAFT_2310717 [Mycena leptocephala]|nr:hypothetical protein B0H13DRAFT_2310717 [Mycena leptocephala]